MNLDQLRGEISLEELLGDDILEKARYMIHDILETTHSSGCMKTMVKWNPDIVGWDNRFKRDCNWRMICMSEALIEIEQPNATIEFPFNKTERDMNSIDLSKVNLGFRDNEIIVILPYVEEEAIRKEMILNVFDIQTQSEQPAGFKIVTDGKNDHLIRIRDLTLLNYCSSIIYNKDNNTYSMDGHGTYSFIYKA